MVRVGSQHGRLPRDASEQRVMTSSGQEHLRPPRRRDVWSQSGERGKVPRRDYLVRMDDIRLHVLRESVDAVGRGSPCAPDRETEGGRPWVPDPSVERTTCGAAEVADMDVVTRAQEERGPGSEMRTAGVPDVEQAQCHAVV